MENINEVNWLLDLLDCVSNNKFILGNDKEKAHRRLIHEIFFFMDLELNINHQTIPVRGKDITCIKEALIAEELVKYGKYK